MVAKGRLRSLLLCAMLTVAEQLRQARESLNLDIHQVAEATKLKSDHVRALEEGDYGPFSAPVYLRGSVRTYAKYLKLDPTKLVVQLDAEMSQSGEGAEPAFAPPRPKSSIDSVMLLFSRVNWLVAGSVIAAALLALAALASYRAWQGHKHNDPLKKLGPGIYAPPAGGEMLPLPTNTARGTR